MINMGEFMDEKGFIFTMDAALMLIPIFILVAAVSHVNLVVPYESPYYNAQDALDALYYSDVNSSLVNNLSINTTTSIAAANYTAQHLIIINSFNCPYTLNYALNNGAERPLFSNGTQSSGTVSTARRIQGNVTLILYMWH